METKIRRSSFATQLQVLTRRSFVNMYRDLGYYWMRLAIYIMMAVSLGTIFSDLGFDYNSIQAKGWLIVFVCSFLTFMAIGGFPSFVEEMKVFRQERLNRHYGATAYVASNLVSSLPYLVLVSLIPGAIVYHLSGLRRNYQNFQYFVSILFSSILVVEGLMMIVASLVPNFLTGIIIGAGIQGMMILGGGYFRLPNDLPKPVWKYPMYYISYNKYSCQGLFKNEFEGLYLRDSNITGSEILKGRWQFETGYSKWINVAILLGMGISYRVLFLAIVKISEKLKPAIQANLGRRSAMKQVQVDCSDPSA